ncbi:triose-phosphate isomerase [Thermodesulforhabdus norvegica]|uniref:Triosephosphate isomerase n=1 Tax=Thermodesulforhabdus norvegica TaxID=39841 RepID=A0A1I4VJD9_9BACT|nr:triose-phosphate isomerase [Thermodesulforhabdus norvegica]SFN01394.1 triosephosphate isomerase [Thermodesulforhabdus norvegica]
MVRRKNLIAANWKMHKTVSEAVGFVRELQKSVGTFDDREVLIAPPFTALLAVSKELSREDFFLGGQNCHWEEKGAYTGEVSVPMLKDVGCRYVIVGHSERRHIFKEDDEVINKKVRAAVKWGLVPILCVGEMLEEREAGKTFEIVSDQLEKGLKDVDLLDGRSVVIAYEPVWAIGTGRTATPEQAQEVHSFIREKLSGSYGKDIAHSVRILYGGSVKPSNVDDLMKEEDVDGLLVGGASLEVESFRRIIEYQQKG